MNCSVYIALTVTLILVPVSCLPIIPVSTVTEQDHSSSIAEEEKLKIVSVQHYEPSSNNIPVAMSKKKPNIPPEDPTTKVPSMSFLVTQFIVL